MPGNGQKPELAAGNRHHRLHAKANAQYGHRFPDPTVQNLPHQDILLRDTGSWRQDNAPKAIGARQGGLAIVTHDLHLRLRHPAQIFHNIIHERIPVVYYENLFHCHLFLNHPSSWRSVITGNLARRRQATPRQKRCKLRAMDGLVRKWPKRPRFRCNQNSNKLAIHLVCTVFRVSNSVPCIAPILHQKSCHEKRYFSTASSENEGKSPSNFQR